jgi:uncharacterized membrane protein YgdD (TMEM256/DUF423 family)
MERLFMRLCAAAGFLAVAAGAFGAHALGKAWAAEPQRMVWWEKGVLYHLVHALALLAAAFAAGRFPGRLSAAAGFFFAAGIVLFSGSLYLLAATGARWLGMVTPLGGTAFLLGWVALFASARGAAGSR